MFFILCVSMECALTSVPLERERSVKQYLLRFLIVGDRLRLHRMRLGPASTYRLKATRISLFKVIEGFIIVCAGVQHWDMFQCISTRSRPNNRRTFFRVQDSLASMEMTKTDLLYQ